MGYSIRGFESEVLDLDAESRARLARVLIRSLEFSSEEEIEKIWGQDTRVRAQELKQKR